MTNIKRILLYRSLRGSMAILILIFTLLGTADSHPEQGKTVFEGWERPEFPPAHIAETECETSEEATVEDIIIPETYEDHTLCEPVTEEIFFETEAVTFDETVPKLLVSKPMDTKDPEIYMYKITVSQWKKSVVCGILLILHTEADSGIYDVMPENIPSEIYLSYIINVDKTAVLIDGIINNDGLNTEICFYVLAKKDAGKLYAEVVDYEEMP